MKNLLLAGCSHSTGYGLDSSTPAWYDIIGEQFNYNITNVALNGSSVDYSIQSISDNIINKDYDLVIFQLTTLNRFTLPVDGEAPFLYGDITNFQYNTNGLLHLCEAHHADAINDKINDFDIVPEIVKFIYQKVTLSRYHINSLINRIHFIQSFLDSKNIKLALVPYDDYDWGNKSRRSIWNLEESKKIDKKYYVDYPFMQWLKDNYNPEDYYIDKGFHLGAEGQKLFAYEYLIPRLTELNIL